MPKPPNGKSKSTRLALPARHKETITYINDALTCLRQAESFHWQRIGRDEPRFNPFFHHFDERTRETIDRLARLNGVSRSRIVMTALELYRHAPRVGAKPSGYRSTD